MNSLFSSSFSKYSTGGDAGGGDGLGPGDVQMSSAAGANLDRFLVDVEAVKEELKELETLHKSLHESNEAGKSLHQSSAVRALRARMDADVATALKKAKHVKLKLEALDRANAANRSQPGCGPGSSTDRARTSVVAGLRKNLKDTMESFSTLRARVQAEYREAVERRYYTVTGNKPDETTLDSLIETGEAERFLQRAIQQQGGRGEVMDVVTEIRERHDAAKEIERSLHELHQVFLDMSVLVNAQGEQLDDIESQLNRASSFVRGGTENLVQARTLQKNTRKWTCIAIVILLIIILAIVLPIVLNNTKKN